jgi:hypothetical protein
MRKPLLANFLFLILSAMAADSFAAPDGFFACVHFHSKNLQTQKRITDCYATRAQRTRIAGKNIQTGSRVWIVWVKTDCPGRMSATARPPGDRDFLRTS